MATNHSVTTEPRPVRILLIASALLVLSLFLLMPLVAVFAEALRRGWELFLTSLHEPAAASAIRLTLLAAAVAVPVNTVFGVAAAWLITKHRFRGRSLLLSLIDLPFAVSPVIAGLVWVMIFGSHGWLPPKLLAECFAPLAGWVHEASLYVGFGWLGPLASWLERPEIIFATPGIIIATVFITFPFVARELIPLMESQGNDQEEAACVRLMS